MNNINLQTAVAALKSKILKGVAILVAVVVAMSSWFQTDAGYIYVVQDTAFGSMRTYDQPGLHIKVPFFTNVYSYKEVATIAFGSEDSGNFTRTPPPATVTFADTYNGQVPATFRFRLSRDPEKILKMHNEFRGFENLVDSMLVKNARNVTVVTGTQYTGEEFFQGGLNAFKVKLEDQLRNGLYETVRRQVPVESMESVPMSSTNIDASALAMQTNMVWKNVILTDKDEKPLRLSNPLDDYGIVVTQVTIDRPIPEERLQTLLTTKKDLVAKRISAEQKIETAKAEAKAVTQEMEIEKQKAIQIAQKSKELAVIAGQQTVEVEKQQTMLETVKKEKEKTVAVIQKNKELAIAEANKNIEKANSEAAKFQALAITEKGLAEAEVDRAKLAAKQSAKDIYLAEMQRDIAQTMYGALKDFNVQMPQNVIMGGDGGGKLPSNLDALTAFGALGVMEKSAKPIQ